MLYIRSWTFEIARQKVNDGDTVESMHFVVFFCIFEGKNMENYITLTEAAQKWHLSTRRVRTLCNEGRIKGASKFGRNWAIPADAKKPDDNRIKTGKYIKSKAE